MRAKVVKLYRDKNSKVNRKNGEIIKMSEERFEEINSTSFGIFLERVEDLDEEHDKKNAEEQPAEEQPAEEQPAEEQPAEEQPAEEQPAKEKNTTQRKTKSR